MCHNTKLAFWSFKKGSEEEKLMQMEQFLKIISSKVTQTSVFLLYRSVIKSLFFTFWSLNYHHSNEQLCK